MIEKKTVLILGAGASLDYGYPSGADLKRIILNKCEITNMLEGAVKNNKGMGDSVDLKSPFEEQAFLHKDCGISIDMIKSFRNDFGASPRNSIDAFLENRPAFLPLGKMLISMSILGCENFSLISNNPNRNNWYGYLFNILARTWDGFKKNKLQVVTYNYDRSFETYFIEALRSTFGETYNDCASTFYNTINVMHIHGRVSRLLESYSVKPYNQKVEGQYVKAGANELRIIHEEDGLAANYSMVHQALLEAEQIFILGFGFDERNLERLKLHNYDAPIYATRYGISDLNVNRINELAKGSILFSPNRDTSIVDFFDNEASLYGYVSSKMPKKVIPSRGYIGRN